MAMARLRAMRKKKGAVQGGSKDSKSSGDKPKASKKQLTAFARMQSDFGELELPTFVQLNKEDIKV